APAVALDGSTMNATWSMPSGFTVTLAVWVSATVPSTEADTVLVSALVELNVPVATPLASVCPAGCVSVLFVPVAASATLAPLIAFPYASVTVTVMVVELGPVLAVIVVGEALTVEVTPLTAAGVTVTVAVCAIATALIVAETVFASVTVELSVPVATPLALVGPTGCVSVLPVPVAANTTVAPATALPCRSRAVTVMVEVSVTAAMDAGAAAMVDRAASTAPGDTVTMSVPDQVSPYATVELSVPVATPLAFVTPVGCVRVFPVPLAARTTVAPATGLPWASRAVTVIVDVSVAAVMDVGAATTVDWTAS